MDIYADIHIKNDPNIKFILSSERELPETIFEGEAKKFRTLKITSKTVSSDIYLTEEQAKQLLYELSKKLRFDEYA